MDAHCMMVKKHRAKAQNAEVFFLKSKKNKLCMDVKALILT